MEGSLSTVFRKLKTPRWIFCLRSFISLRSLSSNEVSFVKHQKVAFPDQDFRERCDKTSGEVHCRKCYLFYSPSSEAATRVVL